MKKPRATVVAAVVLGCLLLGGAARVAQPDIAGAAKSGWVGPVITVSGNAEVQRRPDFAVVLVGVELRDGTAGGASEKAGAIMKKVGEAVTGLQLAGMQLQTSGVSLNPAYSRWSEEQERKLLGYDAASMLRVRIDDPTKVGAIIDTAVNAGANRVHGISFELKGALEARQEALTMAAKAARDKARTLAEALGLQLRDVITATTSSDQPQPWGTMNMMSNSVRADGAGGLGEAIEPGMVTVRAEATVSFAAQTNR